MSKASKAKVDVKALDPLLECLVFLTSHFGRAKSAESLTAGLAYDARGMGPDLFCEAAERLGLSAKIVKRQFINKIPSAVLPAVLVLKDEHVCVLLSVSPNGKKAKIFSPETGAVREITLNAVLLENRCERVPRFVIPDQPQKCRAHAE